MLLYLPIALRVKSSPSHLDTVFTIHISPTHCASPNQALSQPRASVLLFFLLESFSSHSFYGFSCFLWLLMLQWHSTGMSFLWGLCKGVSTSLQKKYFISHNLVYFFSGSLTYLKSTLIMYFFNGLLFISFHQLITIKKTEIFSTLLVAISPAPSMGLGFLKTLNK